MASYVTPAEFISRYREALEVVAPGETPGTIDETELPQPIADASQEIDTWLGARYSIPLPRIPEVLVRLAADIAIYRMSSECAELTEERRTRYDDAISLLKSISRGDASLGLDDPDPAPSVEGAFVTQSGRVFSRDSLRGY